MRLLIVATATSEPPDTTSQWTHREIAAHLHDTHGIAISPSQVGRILTDADIKPHKVRGWLNRPDDPQFFTRTQAICHLYQHITPASESSTTPPSSHFGCRRTSWTTPSECL